MFSKTCTHFKLWQRSMTPPCPPQGGNIAGCVANIKHARNVLFILITLVSSLTVYAQPPAKISWQLGHERTTAGAPLAGLRSNSVSDIVVHNGEVWLGTGKGLARSSDGGETWVTYTHANGLPRGGLSSLAVSDSIIWVATAFDSLVPEGLLPAGGGLAYSTDKGATWAYVEQPGPTPIQNITFDIALHPTGVWIASFGGGLQRTANRGQSWEVVPPDSFFFDPLGNLNHRVFSVINADGNLWVGTAGGVNKSLDGGNTWTNFSHQNQTQAISGNFVVALGQQKWRGREYLWAATVNAEAEDEFRAVSVSDDGGYSWHVSLEDEFAHNFAFDDSIAYVVSDNGLFRSNDFGRTWAKFPSIEDREQGQRYLSNELFAAGVLGSRLFAGGPDGLASTDDDGANWHIARGSVAAGEDGTPRTYAYPNPFSPFRHNQLNNEGHVRFQYNTTRATEVTIKVFDFAMDLVAEVVARKSRPVAGNYFEVWDGKNYRGDTVANGVYFYRVELAGEGAQWGKLIVLD